MRWFSHYIMNQQTRNRYPNINSSIFLKLPLHYSKLYFFTFVFTGLIPFAYFIEYVSLMYYFIVTYGVCLVTLPSPLAICMKTNVFIQIVFRIPLDYFVGIYPNKQCDWAAGSDYSVTLSLDLQWHPQEEVLFLKWLPQAQRISVTMPWALSSVMTLANIVTVATLGLCSSNLLSINENDFPQVLLTIHLSSLNYLFNIHHLAIGSWILSLWAYIKSLK